MDMYKPKAYSLLSILLLSLCHVVWSDELENVQLGDHWVFRSGKCEDPSLAKTHTWYLLNEHTKVWSSCGFPNPRHDMVRCGRTPPLPNVTQPLYTVCDPDNVLTADEAYQVDQAVWRFAEQTPHQCTGYQQQKINFTLMFALVNYMRSPDLSQEDVVCVNECNEVQPTLNLRDQYPDELEKYVALHSFTAGLNSSWQQELCDSAIVYVIWANKKMASLVVGKNVSKHISGDETRRILEESRKYVERGKFKDALLYVAEAYRGHLKENSPAIILLGLFGLIMVLMVVALVFLFYGSDPFGYWDELEILSPLIWLVKAISGIYLVEYLLVCIMYLQYRLRVWHTGVLFVAVLLLFFVFMAK